MLAQGRNVPLCAKYKCPLPGKGGIQVRGAEGELRTGTGVDVVSVIRISVHLANKRTPIAPANRLSWRPIGWKTRGPSPDAYPYRAALLSYVGPKKGNWICLLPHNPRRTLAIPSLGCSCSLHSWPVWAMPKHRRYVCRQRSRPTRMLRVCNGPRSRGQAAASSSRPSYGQRVPGPSLL